MTASVKDNSVKREGKCSVRSVNGLAVLDESYSFVVVCTLKNESYVNVVTAVGIPRIGEVSPTGFGVCRAVNATRREQNPLYWDVTADFSSEVQESSSQQDPSQDPTVWVPVYETKFERIQEVVTRDLAGTAIANSAGQPFPVGLTVNRFIPVWEFFQIEAPVSDEVIIERNETINSGQFKGRAAKSLLLTVISSQLGFYYGARRRLTQYSLKYNSRLWTHKRLDVGTVYLDGGVHKPYLDDTGKVINGGLNGSGAKVAVGSPPAVRTFEQYTQVNFSPFLRI